MAYVMDGFVVRAPEFVFPSEAPNVAEELNEIAPEPVKSELIA
jgi:hypothetical protein